MATAKINACIAEIERIRSVVRNAQARSAWQRGVATYADHLLEELALSASLGYAPEDVMDSRLNLKAALLNGAENWQQYSYGGCALIFDEDIAEVLCTPSELKRKDGGRLPPNSRETWLDVQTRALHQACDLILRNLPRREVQV